MVRRGRVPARLTRPHRATGTPVAAINATFLWWLVADEECFDLIRARTREGMAVAKAKGRLRGKRPKLSKAQETHLVSVHLAGTHTTVELAELFGVARSTVYRAIKRAGDTTV